MKEAWVLVGLFVVVNSAWGDALPPIPTAVVDDDRGFACRVVLNGESDKAFTSGDVPHVDGNFELVEGGGRLLLLYRNYGDGADTKRQMLQDAMYGSEILVSNDGAATAVKVRLGISAVPCDKDPWVDLEESPFCMDLTGTPIAAALEDGGTLELRTSALIDNGYRLNEALRYSVEEHTLSFGTKGLDDARNYCERANAIPDEGSIWPW